MGRRILFVFIAITGFILLNLGWHIYEKNWISHIYDMLEENIKITDAERIPAETINEVIESGGNSPSAADFKKEFVQTVNDRLHTNLTSEQLTVTCYDTNLNINFMLDNKISYLYRYSTPDYISKTASIEKNNRLYISLCGEYNRVERSLDYDKSGFGFGFWLIIYCSVGALIFIILGILFTGQIQYKDFGTGDIVDINKFSMFKGRLPSLALCVVIAILPVLAIIYINNIYNPNYISNKTYRILEENSLIHEEERLPVELIKNTLNDYQDLVTKQDNSNSLLRYNFHEEELELSIIGEKEVSAISDNLKKLIEEFIAREKSVLGCEVVRDDIAINFYSDTITIYFDKINKSSNPHEYYTFYYFDNGHMSKQLLLDPNAKKTSYETENFNNWYSSIKKNTFPYDYRKWSMMICSWICAFICIAFGEYISERKSNIRVWNKEQKKFMLIHGCHIPDKISLNRYGVFLFLIGILAYINFIGSTATLCLIGSVAAIAFFEYFRKSKSKLILMVSILIIMPVVILTGIWIQREIKWINTRHDMDIQENDILQKIDISANERLPKEMLDGLVTAIMNNESKDLAQSLPEFEALTAEFLLRINKQMNLSLQPEDLSGRCAEKDNLEGTGDRLIASYNFTIGDEVYFYYYQIDRIGKMIIGENKNDYHISIRNDNNETIYASYNTWRYGSGRSESVSKSDYDEFMESWEKGELSYKYITIKNIQKNSMWWLRH